MWEVQYSGTHEYYKMHCVLHMCVQPILYWKLRALSIQIEKVFVAARCLDTPKCACVLRMHCASCVVCVCVCVRVM